MTCNKNPVVSNFKYQEPKHIVNQRPDCTKCHPDKQARCRNSSIKYLGAGGTDSPHKEVMPQEKWQLIGGRRQVGIAFDADKRKVIRKIYGRTADRYAQTIHPWGEKSPASISQS